MTGIPTPEAGVSPIRVFIVDDHEVVRLGLRAFLTATSDVEPVGDAPDGRTALERLDALAAQGALPDVVLMDLVLPGLDGSASTALIKKAYPEVSVVVVTSFGEARRVHGALEAGATGYVLKDADVQEIVRAIRAAHRGEVHLDPTVTGVLTRSLIAPQRGVTALTNRERDVLVLVAQGLSNRDIGKALSIGERTVQTHLGNLLTKLGLASRTQAALWAVREGLLEP
ncbi:MAG TPA: response regulator transcription factor [Actinophytocola sp.]|nr:response regulator transcription factor [Actinophytocola sp.]